MVEGSLWEGDAGTLPLEVRVAVARLVADYAVDDAARFEGRALLDVIAANREDVERALADCMLVLVTSERYHVAWAEPAHVEGMADVAGPKVARRVSGTVAYAMCVCREVALECEAEGTGTPTIDADVLAERLSEMPRWRDAHDARGVAKAAQDAMDRMCRLHLLKARRGSTDYEIRPLLSAIVDESWLREMAEAGPGAEAGPTQGAADGDEGGEA